MFISSIYIINVVMIMTSIQISIKKEIYEKLKALKKNDESYSEIIERLMNGQGNLQDVIKCYGIARGENEKEIHDAYQDAQKIIRETIKSRIISEDENEE
jgi:predicted CopG family antitoxin